MSKTNQKTSKLQIVRNRQQQKSSQSITRPLQALNGRRKKVMTHPINRNSQFKKVCNRLNNKRRKMIMWRIRTFPNYVSHRKCCYKTQPIRWNNKIKNIKKSRRYKKIKDSNKINNNSSNKYSNNKNKNNSNRKINSKSKRNKTSNKKKSSNNKLKIILEFIINNFNNLLKQ